ncbi:hypothetical protein [Xanthomonas sacchari]|uniref:Type IV secretion protein Rhs n=1 Tax=Xanthomonas sacchari TaxID=56458 RepID=A0A2P5Z1C6_9XANT|nr:hypothetical protein [Xanthomonas sacchari]MDV0439765.1 hypothetical protein [Xanthomonas sacchari]PPU81259.1 hypothetical protein XsacCFBP4641_15360 [Xanthomonas sacchari]
MTFGHGSFAPQALPAARSGSFDDNNRQTQADGQALSYDANGNLVSDGVRTYVWNARDQWSRSNRDGEHRQLRL